MRTSLTERPLGPDDILESVGGVQLATLPGDRLLVRHRGGVSVLRDVARGDVEAVLAEVDGRRTAAEVVAAACTQGVDAVLARRVLRLLLGDVLVHRELAAGEVLLLAGGAVARSLEERLRRRGLEPFTLAPTLPATRLADRLGRVDLLLVAPEQTAYRWLLDVQRAALDTGVPSLFVTADADGVRVGPSSLPGATACFACSLLAAFAFLAGEPGTLDALGELRTGCFDGLPATPAALAALVDEAQRLLDPRCEPELLAHVLHFDSHFDSHFAGQDAVRRPVLPHPGCPLCRGRSPAGPAALAGRAAARLVEVRERRAPRAAREADGHEVQAVGILGGGTAGYLTALALRRSRPELAVTLIESSRLPVIGVGEATTPLLPQFLHADLGLDIHELFREVRPTFKLGVRFDWGEGVFSYPFGPVRPLEAMVWSRELETCSLRALLMREGLLPASLETLGTEVAYHLDNARFVRWLKAKAVERGVEIVDATIADVIVDETGEEVRELVTDDARRCRFDLYVDASGFRSRLIGQALGSPFLSYASSLFTDRALIGSAPIEAPPPYTLAATMRAGWCWSTPQRSEDHRGYVYSSAFLSADEAEAEMRRHCPGLGEVREVRFTAGRREHFWKGNVIAVGNAYGFVEPLESTALHMLIRQIGRLVRAFPLRRGERGLPRVLDREVGAAWDYLRFFLTLHFKFNRRLDSPFWRACLAEAELGPHGELVTTFEDRGPLSYDAASLLHVHPPDPLWGLAGVDLLLLGQGVASRWPTPRTSHEAWERQLEQCRTVLRASRPAARVLAELEERPQELERLAATFREVGPAFLGRWPTSDS